MMKTVKQNWQLAPVTLTLTIGMVLVFVMQLVLSGGLAISQAILLKMGAQDAPDIILHHEWWRLLTAGFLHANGMHLLLNVLVFYYLGRILESALGHWQLAALFLFSIVTGNLAELAFLSRLGTIGIGASGGVFGLIAAIIYLGWMEKRPGFWQGQAKTMLLFVALNVLFDIFTPNIGHWAHAVGFIGGGLLAPALLQSTYAKQTFRRPRGRSSLGLVLCGLLVFALGLWIYVRFGGY
ncbi:rhomboid family intramembrane serine protease [Weissella halotolerans]|nr:rhomboid family intramembrane serine protease [Weissella halotolerans]